MHALFTNKISRLLIWSSSQPTNQTINNQYIKDKFSPSPKLLAFEEIGWTITIPSKFKLLSQKEINRITKASKKSNDDTEPNDNSNCKKLFMAILGKRNLIQGSSSYDNSNTTEDLEKITLQEKSTLISAFEKKFANFFNFEFKYCLCTTNIQKGIS